MHALGPDGGLSFPDARPRHRARSDLLVGVRRIIAIRPDNIGDVVMLGPALRAIRAAAPDAHLALLASPAGQRAAALLPWIDEVLVERVSWQQLPRPGAVWDAEADRRLVDRLRDGRYDAAFVFTSFSQTPWPAAYACLLAGIPVRVGQAAEFGGAVLTHAVAPAATGTHQVERNLHLLEAAGIPVADRALEVRVPAEAHGDAAGLLLGAGVDPAGHYVVVAPGASAEARRYPVHRFEAAARAIVAGGAGPVTQVVLVGGPEDVDRLAPVGAVRGVASLVGQTSIAQLAAVIAGAAGLVTSHSAPMHLADALGVPVVVAFSGTDLRSEWGPRRTPSVLLGHDVPCAPCRQLRCPFGLECLDVTPDEVVGALRRLVSSAAARVPAASPPAIPAPAGEVRWLGSAS